MDVFRISTSLFISHMDLDFRSYFIFLPNQGTKFSHVLKSIEFQFHQALWVKNTWNYKQLLGNYFSFPVCREQMSIFVPKWHIHKEKQLLSKITYSTKQFIFYNSKLLDIFIFNIAIVGSHIYFQTLSAITQGDCNKIQIRIWQENGLFSSLTLQGPQDKRKAK